MKRDIDCVDGNMDVLMYDCTTKKAKDLKKDDAVYAISYDGNGFKYVKANVLEINRRKSPAVKITLNDKRTLISSTNHQWLTQAGWHFSYDNGSIKDNVLYLKENMIMFGFSKNLTGTYRENKLFMAGYIISIEIYGKNMIHLHSGEYAEYVFQNQNITTRIYNYFTYLGIETSLSDCFVNNMDTNEYFVSKKLSVSYKDLLKFSEKYSKYKNEAEFIRGFVSGVYDSDGALNPISKSVNNPKKEYLEVLKSGMELYEFEYSYNSEFMEVSLIGGPTELIRFYNIFTPITACMVENLNVRNRRVDNTRIASIEETRCDDLFEITTTARNFIANGIVCHNCTTGLVR